MSSMWEVKQKWDDLFFTVCNGLYRIRYFKDGGARGHGLLKNTDLSNCHNGSRVCVVGNGPSVQKQNLKLLANEIVFFVNRGFLHPDYEFISPRYHVFVDPKMASGEWPLSFLDEVAEKNPDVIFLLNSRWFGLPKFQKYKNKYRIYWLAQTLFMQSRCYKLIDLSKIGVGGAVVEQCVLASLYMGAKDIYFVGVDGNGLCYNLVDKQSHYYGSNSEDLESSFMTTVINLSMMSKGLQQWSRISMYCEYLGINLVNLTEGGVIDCCKRQQFEDIFNDTSCL
jgi:hypothetical protein